MAKVSRQYSKQKKSYSKGAALNSSGWGQQHPMDDLFSYCYLLPYQVGCFQWSYPSRGPSMKLNRTNNLIFNILKVLHWTQHLSPTKRHLKIIGRFPRKPSSGVRNKKACSPIVLLVDTSSREQQTISYLK